MFPIPWIFSSVKSNNKRKTGKSRTLIEQLVQIEPKRTLKAESCQMEMLNKSEKITWNPHSTAQILPQNSKCTPKLNPIKQKSKKSPICPPNFKIDIARKSLQNMNNQQPQPPPKHPWHSQKNKISVQREYATKNSKQKPKH